MAKIDWKERIAEASKGKSSTSRAYSLVQRNLVTWFLLTALSIFLGATNYKSKRIPRGVADQWYGTAVTAFLFGIAFAAMGYSSAKTEEKKKMALVLMGCDFMALTTWYMHANRLGIVTIDSSGNPVDIARYLEWLTCCPCLVLLIGELTNNNALATSTLYWDYIMLGFGLLGALMKEPYSQIFACLASASFVYLVSGLWEMFTNAIEGTTKCSLDTHSLKLARFSTNLCWWAFPVTWYLQKTKLIPFGHGEMLFCCADIGAKVFLTLVLINASVEQAQNMRVEALSLVASDMQVAMGSTDALLEKMMPPGVLEALKNGKTEAEEFQDVTVFFSDICQFTVLSSKTSTKDMLATLNKLWLEYDKVAKKWGIFKVETIGDAYLGVVGAPDRVPDHAARAVNFAVDIIDMVKQFKTAMDTPIQIRVGLNSGMITAGVLGDLNPHWCIVGDTVNTASRMESTSKPMCIHISESTYSQVKNSGFKISEPDVMTVKGKGEMTTYWVYGRN